MQLPSEATQTRLRLNSFTTSTCWGLSSWVSPGGIGPVLLLLLGLSVGGRSSKLVPADHTCVSILWSLFKDCVMTEQWEDLSNLYSHDAYWASRLIQKMQMYGQLWLTNSRSILNEDNKIIQACMSNVRFTWWHRTSVASIARLVSWGLFIKIATCKSHSVSMLLFLPKYCSWQRSVRNRYSMLAWCLLISTEDANVWSALAFKVQKHGEWRQWDHTCLCSSVRFTWWHRTSIACVARLVIRGAIVKIAACRL